MKGQTQEFIDGYNCAVDVVRPLLEKANELVSIKIREDAISGFFGKNDLSCMKWIELSAQIKEVMKNGQR